MSTHSSIPEMRGGIGLSVFSLLSGLLLALQLVLSPVALASSSSPERVSTPALTEQGVLDLAGVSLVRLVVTYTTTHTPIVCTGLGTLLGSWSPTSLSEKNTWVLTDGTLVSQSGQTCASPARGQLTSIQMYANTAYTHNLSPPVVIGQLTCQQGQSQKPSCRDSVPETLSSANGAVLVSLHTDVMHLQPLLGVAQQQGTGLQLGIELEDPTATATPWPASPVLGTTPQPQPYLTPKAVNTQTGSLSSGTPSSNPSLNSPYEPGMPILNSDGNVIGMSLTGGKRLTGQSLLNLTSLEPEFQPAAQSQHANLLNSSWEQGIKQYEAGDYAAAQVTLQQITAANPQFRAAAAFEQLAAAKSPRGPNGTPTGTPQPAAVTPGVSGILIFVGLVAGLIVLVLLLVLVTLLAGRARGRRQELARFEADRIEAQRIADRDVQRQQQNRLSILSLPTILRVQFERASKLLSKRRQTIPVQQTASVEQKLSTVSHQSPPDMLCPNCGHKVRASATYCPNCRYLLSAAARAAPPTLNILPKPELSTSDKVVAPSTITSQPQQAPVKEAALDDLAIQATLQHLWDKAGR